MATRRLSNVLLRNLPRLSALNTGTVRSSGITTVHRNITSSSVVRKEMLEVTFETGDGASYTVKGREGDNLLDVIVNNDVDLDGFGACEGTLSCSTCHLIFKQEDFDQIDDPCTDEELDMLDLAYGLTDTGACVSLSGSGFLGIYELGAVNCLQRYWPRLMDNADVAGASAGALLAACLVCGVPLETVRGMLLSTAEEARKNVIGPFSPNFKIEHHLRMGLEDFLPLDAHVRANGRLYVSLTKMEGVPSNILVSNWDSKEDLIACLLCSCFIPLFSGVQLPEFRGEKFMDGGFTNNLPRTSKNTVTISPFSGMIDICPSDNIEKPIYVTVANEKLVVSYANVVRFIRALIPPPDLELRNLFYVGYHDAHSFLKWRCSKINNRRKH